MTVDYLEGFDGRRCLLTGHTGFKGTWLGLWLNRLGAEVTGLALPPDATQDLFIRVGAGNRLDSTYGDIRDRAALDSVLEASRPEVVFHLAAQSLVRRGYDQPADTMATNVMGTVNLLEAVRTAPSVRAVVIVTSDKCYLTPTPRRPLREDDPLGGSDPYSASKAAAEVVTAAYRHSYFSHGPTLVATARAGNVIGAGDGAADRLVPDIVRALGRGEPVRLRNPDSLRPWQHVLEPLRGYLMVAARLLEGDRSAARAWNFGPDANTAVTVRELAARFLAAWGEGEVVIEAEPGAPPETDVLRLDATLARDLLGYEPVVGIEDAITLTVDGYRQLAQGDDTVLDRQIADYTRRLG